MQRGESNIGFSPKLAKRKLATNDRLTDLEKDDKGEIDKSGSASDMAAGSGSLERFDDETKNGFLVDFEDKDPQNPLNWRLSKKLFHTMIYGVATLAAQFNSTTTAPSVTHLADYFDVSREKALLGTTLYVVGVAFGPMFFAPLSEMYGRKVGVFGPLFISMAFTLGSASSKDYSSLLVTRFFAGFFGGSPIVSSGGVIADIWPITTRAIALVFYAMFVVCGVTVGPVISALLTYQVGTDEWRWPLWLICIIQGVLLVVAALTVSESFKGVILAKRAKMIRKQSGNWAYHAKHEEWDLDFSEYLSVHLLRPFAMLATPIVFALALFASYVFGILYLIVTSVPLAFELTRGWEGTVSNLPILSVLVGVLIGCTANIWGGLRYRKLLEKNDGVPLPEERFPPMMMFGWLMPAGMFIFAWTSQEKIHWIAPCIGLSCMAFGFFVIFQGCLNYLVDSFTRYAASAIAANTFLRSILGGVFPLFGPALFKNLGVNWGGSTIAFIALGMIPIPFVFYAFGSKIRSKNPYIKRIS
ncbi:LAMI_0B00166g1_1 [Lachancea mirantina]|uniref:LAMI_0B00166g1_1 n=1 Tax=Lachancea mirantina TaxID=1230905 RepID=A0A1G4ITA4_9SACH|nr:LAMI_0B00166g1_1 [Lachancea mirantina]